MADYNPDFELASHRSNARLEPQKAKMSDNEEKQKLREFARLEDAHILSQLVEPEERRSGEDAQELAERNCGATERCFGENDPLHAMALNTLAFVYLHKNSGKAEELAAARDLAAQAFAIVRDGNGGGAPTLRMMGQSFVSLRDRSDDREEFLLESQCLFAWAWMRMGISASKATLDFVPSHPESASVFGDLRAASNALCKTLEEASCDPLLTRVVLMRTLAEIGFALLKEMSEAGVDESDKSGLEQHLVAFADNYSGQREPEE